ncbi:isochorismate synthase [Kribbella sp. NPDC023855]|uniref:isochorismate synthase n=1 Tax=Kribbella sp. NPDC023855 TaxID=3154698 RepID=UPI0033EC6C44
MTTTEEIATLEAFARLEESLERLVPKARRRAHRLRKPVLACASTVLDIAGSPQRLLWLATRNPEWASLAGAEANLIAWGSAGRLRDNADLAVVDQDWSELVAGAVRDELSVQTANPFVVFGHSFADECDSMGPWRNFGRSRTSIPQISVRAIDGTLVATASAIVGTPVLPREPSIDGPDTSRQPRPSWADAEGAYVSTLGQAIEHLKQGDLEKVVLTRVVQARTTGIEPVAILSRLDNLYPETCRFAVALEETTFLGATPELLCSVRGRLARTMALAGSVPADVGDELVMSDPKLRREHSIVADHIEQTLGMRCDSVRRDQRPRVVSLRNIRHLRTDVSAHLPVHASVLSVAEWLHPTPAIGGHPLPAARALIAELENFDRGWYTGPIGWADAAGDGDCWVALRCALLTGDTATMFAGGGIVSDSDPLVELAETNWKLSVMREALGLLPPDRGSTRPKSAAKTGAGRNH